MKADRLVRLAPLTGVVAAALLGVGAALSARGGYFPRPEDAHDYLTRESSAVYAGTALGGYYGSFFLLCFVGSVAGALWKAKGGNEGLATIALGGGVMATIGLALASSVLGVASGRASRTGQLSVEEAIVLFDINTTVGATLVSVGFAVLTGAAGLVILRSGLLPAWLGWTSLVFAAGLLSPIHYVFEGLMFFWLLVVSALLFRQQSAGRIAPVSAIGE